MNHSSLLACGILAVLLLAVLPAAAVPVLTATDPAGRPSVIVEYGTGRDFGLVKVTHIDYAAGPALKPAVRARPAKAANCFKLSGWKWNGPITYTVAGAAGSPLAHAVGDASATWDAAASPVLFAGTVPGNYPWGVRDGKNSVSFGDYPDGDVIAIAQTWYYPSAKEGLESDILFDNDYTWGTVSGSTPDVMDLRNLATHEIGHTLGLSDLYSPPCSAATMYGYSDYGETNKQTLEASDIAGLQRIYGV